MRRDRAWYEEALADEMRAKFLAQREDAAWTVRKYGGQVTFTDEPDWAAKARELIDAEIAKLAYDAICARYAKGATLVTESMT